MKILIAPMAASSETSASYTRAVALAEAFLRRGHQVAFCAALEEDFRPAPGIAHLKSPLPTPIGRKKGARSLLSFDEVLYHTGALAYGFFKADVACLCAAIQVFAPDLVYAECRPAAVVAARQEMVSVLTSYSYPIQRASDDNRYVDGVNNVLRELGQQEAVSACALLDRADMKIVPSVKDLDPVKGEDVLFTGPFHKLDAMNQSGVRDKIVVHLGGDPSRHKKLLAVVEKAFQKTLYGVYVSGKGVPVVEKENLHAGDQLDLHALLPQAAVFVNHGEQNNIMTALCCGTPQIIFPGNVFERRYKAQCAVEAGAALQLEEADFVPKLLRKCSEEITVDRGFLQRSTALGQELRQAGGADLVVELVERAQ